MKLTGYTRLASAEDDLASRLDALRAAGCTEIIHEYANRDRRNRTKLKEAISHLRAGDTLIVTDLDCVAWSLLQLTELLASLRDRGIMFRSIESPIDTSGPNGPVILKTLLAILSFNDALTRARIHNSRPSTSEARRLQAMEVAARLLAKRPWMTLRQVGSELKCLGYQPPRRGTEWTLSSVTRLVNHAKMTGILTRR